MNDRIRKLPAPTEGGRDESGAVQFGDDWPGLFIRGDNAMCIAMAIKRLKGQLVMKDLESTIAIAELNGLYDIIVNDVDLVGLFKELPDGSGSEHPHIPPSGGENG